MWKASVKRGRRLFQARRAQAVALAVVFVAATTLILIPRRESPQEATAASVQPEATPVNHDAVQPRATSSVRHPTRPSNRASAAAPPATETTRVPSEEIASAQEPRAVTITGCLMRNDDGFRLKDTEGDTAPRSRSWKTGFLKRTNRSVDVVDVHNQFNLATHVGERVNATGPLVDGDMQLRALHRVATSCA